MEADVVVVAVGVLPNSPCVEEGGLAIKRGIIVDEGMQTSKPDIFAAGDVAEVVDLVDGERKVMAIWPNAVEGGRVAGHNMVSEDHIYGRLLLMNSLHLEDLYIVTLGLSWLGDADGFYTVEKYDSGTNCYRKPVCHRNRLLGAILIGDTRSAGFLHRLMVNGENINDFIKPVMEEKIYFAAIRLHSPRSISAYKPKFQTCVPSSRGE